MLIDIVMCVWFVYCGDEVFVLCSMFKLLFVVVVLCWVDWGEEMLDWCIVVVVCDFVVNFLFIECCIGSSVMVWELCEVVVMFSDNVVVNLLLVMMNGFVGLMCDICVVGD